eukprot:superscaffoldBa00000631_g6188
MTSRIPEEQQNINSLPYTIEGPLERRVAEERVPLSTEEKDGCPAALGQLLVVRLHPGPQSPQQWGCTTPSPLIHVQKTVHSPQLMDKLIGHRLSVPVPASIYASHERVVAESKIKACDIWKEGGRANGTARADDCIYKICFAWIEDIDHPVLFLVFCLQVVDIVLQMQTFRWVAENALEYAAYLVAAMKRDPTGDSKDSQDHAHTRADLHQKIRQVVAMGKMYFVPSEYLACQRCKWLGNSSSQIQQKLQEHYAEVWLQKTVQYLTDCRGIAVAVTLGLILLVTFEPASAMPPVPKYWWLMQVYGQDVLQRLDEIKAAFTSQYGRSLKIDSTKKAIRKLEGHSYGTTTWAVNVSNEHGQVIMIWKSQQKHVACIEDPLGVQLHIQMGTVVKGGNHLPTYHCVRDSTSLESFHLHLN